MILLISAVMVVVVAGLAAILYCTERSFREFSEDKPSIQRFDMFIDRIGDYGTNGYESAHVFGLRGANCIGYIVQPNGAKTAAVWHSKDGTRINGPADENLARFVRAELRRGT